VLHDAEAPETCGLVDDFLRKVAHEAPQVLYAMDNLLTIANANGCAFVNKVAHSTTTAKYFYIYYLKRIGGGYNRR
jgi:hypothetical protein